MATGLRSENTLGTPEDNQAIGGEFLQSRPDDQAADSLRTECATVDDAMLRLAAGETVIVSGGDAGRIVDALGAATKGEKQGRAA